MSYQEYLSNFLSYLQFEKNYSPHTIGAYRYDISEFLSYLLLKEEKLENTTPNFISVWIETLSVRKQSPRSLGRKISSLRMFVRFLLKRDKLTCNPFESFSMPKVTKTIPSVLSKEEISVFVDTLPSTTLLDYRNKIMLILLYSTGLRSEELCHLSMGDLSADFSFLRIVGKGKKERQIPLIGWVQNAIKGWISIERKVLDKGLSDAIFLSKNGKSLTTAMIRVIVNSLSLHLPKKISPHVFRYTFASHLLEENANLRHIQELLGHASLSVTERYTSLSVEHLKHTYQKFHPRA